MKEDGNVFAQCQVEEGWCSMLVVEGDKLFMGWCFFFFFHCGIPVVGAPHLLILL